MPAGASPRREAEFKKLEHRFKQEGRYKEREDEVAARVVNKQRSEYGETIEEKQKDKQGRSPDRGLPIRDYQTLTIAEVKSHLDGMSKKDIEKIRSHEAAHKNRKGLLAVLDAHLK
ncbi:MAG TPA: hypothetical protein VJ654_05090 [Noviherbaspirillum sp.]|nr:hypothetical protein [Noviherbaspirillum sp.]